MAYRTERYTLNIFLANWGNLAALYLA